MLYGIKDLHQALQDLLNSAARALGAPVALIGASGEQVPPTIIAVSMMSGATNDSSPSTSSGEEIRVPVVYRTRDYGQLVARSSIVPVNRDLLESFATAAGYILGNAEEIDRSGQALRESTLLREIGALLVVPSELQDSLTMMVRSVKQLFNADYASIATVEADGTTQWRAMDGYRTTTYLNVVFQRGKGIAYRAIAAGKPIALEGIGIAPDLPAEEFPIHVAEGGVSAIAAPLFRAGKAIGAVILGCRSERHWKESEIATLSVVASTVALAIEQSRASTAEGAQRAFLGKIIENFPGALIVLEPPDWRVLVANSNFTSLLPEPYRSGAPVIGLSAREITSEWTEEAEYLIGLFQQVAETGEAMSFEQYASENPERGLRYINWSLVPVEGAGEGGKRVVLLTTYDVTETVLARESARTAADHARARAEELDAIINQMADGVSIFDAEGHALRINPAGQRLLGRNVRRGEDPSDYPSLYGFYNLEGEMLTRERLTFSRALKGEIVVGEQIMVKRANEEYIIISVSGSPLTDSAGKINGAVLVFHDITHEKMTERLKDEFLSVVSHELRTPLSAIMGYGDLMLRGLHGALNERQTRTLNAVRANADRLLRLINDLLDVSKLESGVSLVDPAPVNLAGVVSRTIAQTRVLAVTAGVAIQNDINHAELPYVMADEPKLQQVLENLLSNAIKFTPSGGTVSFKASPSNLDAFDPALVEQEDVPPLVAGASPRSIVVSVTDTGAGLEEEELTRIWDRFYQVDSSAKRRSGGTGLGLAIVRSLIELHGGQAWVMSKGANQGSTFRFSLPVAQGSTSSPREVRSQQPGQDMGSNDDSQPIVLIVEDDADQREIICDMLEMEGYRVVLAADGEEALRLAQEVRPAAIALDVVLPRRDGWEVLNRLKREPATRDIPVLIISVVDQQEFGKSLGADEYLVKPLEASNLRNVVRRLLGAGERKQSMRLSDLSS